MALRLLTVSSLPARSQGGVELLVQDLALAFAQAGIESLLVTNGNPTTDARDGQFSVRMSSIETFRGIPTLRCCRDVIRSFLGVYALLKITRPHIVHVHFIDYPLLYWTALRRWFGYKLIVTGHGAEVTALLRGNRRTLPAMLLPKLVAAADRRTGTAPQISAALSQVCHAQVSTIQNGVNLAFWTPEIKRSPNPGHLVLVGRLSREKGHDLFLHSLSPIVPRYPQMKCTIIGDGPERVALTQLSKDLGLEQVVSFTGMLGRDAIREHLASASVFVMPSLDEGLPIALLEAMASGLAIIATRVGGIPSVLVHEHTALLIEPDDPNAISGAIEALLNHPEIGRMMGVRAMERTADYSLAETVAAYQELYREMMLEPRHGEQM